MLHFASYFLAQQLICGVHVFWLSVPYVPGDLEGIDSNLIVQKSQKRRSERGWNGEHLLVILSEAKDLARWATRSFASLRMTLGGRFVSPRLMSRWRNRLESMPTAPAPRRFTRIWCGG
jgi:hypothetical protein